MRKTLIPFVLAAAGAVPWSVSLAGEGGHHRHGKRADQRLDRAIEAAGVSDAQRTQIDAIQEKYQPQMKALHEQLHALRDQMKSEIDGVLSEAQRAKVREEEKSHRHQHRHRDRG